MTWRARTGRNSLELEKVKIVYMSGVVIRISLRKFWRHLDH